MSRSAIDAILDLPTDARVEAVQQIWESIAARPEAVPVTAAQRAELDRRWESMQRDPDAGESWEDVKRGLDEE